MKLKRSFLFCQVDFFAHLLIFDFLDSAVPDLIQIEDRLKGSRNSFVCGLYVYDVLRHLYEFEDINYCPTFSYDDTDQIRLSMDSQHLGILRCLQHFVPTIQKDRDFSFDDSVSGRGAQETRISTIMRSINILPEDFPIRSNKVLIDAFEQFEQFPNNLSFRNSIAPDNAVVNSSAVFGEDFEEMPLETNIPKINKWKESVKGEIL